MTAHQFENRPPSEWGYNHGCRCWECTARHNLPQRVRAAAVLWVRKNLPQVWQELYDGEYAASGLERRPIGRPTKGSK